MFWPWEVVERDHEIQNPTSPEKIRLLGEYLRLTGESRVLDVGGGKGGPARILAAAFGCRISVIELREPFAEEARERAAAAGLGDLIEVQIADASAVPIEPDSFDAALCLGAAFLWGTIADAAVALRPAVPVGGFVAIGEPFWRQWPLRRGVDAEEFVSLDETIARFEHAGLRTVGLIASSEDDWDQYESLHWRAIEESLAAYSDDPGASDLRARHDRFRGEYFEYKRALLGWAVFVGRKT